MTRVARVLVPVAVAAAALAAALPAAAALPVHVYFLRDETLVAVHRPAPPRTPLTAALRALLAGPSARERGLHSEIPRGTILRGVAVSSGIAVVDLSRRFAAGGGSATMFARLRQLVWTATAVRGVRAVELRLGGKRVRVFSSEGIVLPPRLTRGNVPG